MRTRELVELGAFCINKLRRATSVVFYCSKPISDIPRPKYKPRKPMPDRMRICLDYQLLIDFGQATTRAELARLLDVSPARVTQVLSRVTDRTSEAG